MDRNGKLAEAQGFEPRVPLGTAVFKTAAFDRSATPPLRRPKDNISVTNAGLSGLGIHGFSASC